MNSAPGSPPAGWCPPPPTPAKMAYRSFTYSVGGPRGKSDAAPSRLSRARPVAKFVLYGNVDLNVRKKKGKSHPR